MKKAIITAALIGLNTFTANAQDVYNEIRNKAKAAIETTKDNDITRHINQFKVDALDYLMIKMQEQMPDCKILIYTMHEEPWVIAKLAEEEISGAVSKNASTSELKQAITQIRLGHKYFSEVFSILHKKQINIDLHKIPELSKREKEVLTYLSEGLSTSEISDLLCLSTNTIQTYRKRLMEKLEAKNVAELVYKGKEIF